MAARLLSDKIIVLKQILLADIKMINTKIVTIVREMAIDQWLSDLTAEAMSTLQSMMKMTNMMKMMTMMTTTMMMMMILLDCRGSVNCA